MATQKEQYEAKLLVLKEQKKMHMLTQDAYDKAHAALVKEIFGEEKKEV